MGIIKKIVSYYWIIIPSIIGIILFSMPWWYTNLLFNNDDINESIAENKANVSLVDYSIPFNLKVRGFSIWEVVYENTEDSIANIPSRTGTYRNYTDNIIRANFLIDSLKGKKIDLTIEMTLNLPKDSLSQQEKAKLEQMSMNLIGLEIIKKVTKCSIYIFKETNYTINSKKEKMLYDYNENTVLLYDIFYKN